MRLFIRGVSALSILGGWVAMGLLASAMFVVCQMIFVRYVLNMSTAWQTEYVTYSLTAATFLASPYVLILRGHVGVDLVLEWVSRPTHILLQVINAALSMIFIGLLAYAGWIYFEEAWSGNWTTDTVWALPLWIPLWPFPLGMGLLFLQYIAEVLILIHGDDDDALVPDHVETELFQ